MKLCACGCGKEVKKRGIYYTGHRPEDLTPRNEVCACGCGQPLPKTRQGRYYAARFLKGHNMRVATVPNHVYTPKPEEIPSGLCECGCGGQTELATITNRVYRWFMGHPKPFIVGHHARRSGKKPKLTSGAFLTVADAAYLAGIVDGEGTIMIYPRWVKVSVANTSPELLDWLRRLGGNVSFVKFIENRKTTWHWAVGHRRDCRWLLEQIEPYMVVKREKAQQALDLLKSLPV